MNESVARIEAIIGRKVKRDIGQMTEWAKGNLARAAEAIMNTPNAHVGIVTGFYIQHAEPPAPETDGLGGMAHLAAGLANAGIPVTVITDTPCAKAVWAVVDALPACGYHARQVVVPFGAEPVRALIGDLFGPEAARGPLVAEVQATNLALMDQGLRPGYKEVGLLDGDDGALAVRGP